MRARRLEADERTATPRRTSGLRLRLHGRCGGQAEMQGRLHGKGDPPVDDEQPSGARGLRSACRLLFSAPLDLACSRGKWHARGRFPASAAYLVPHGRFPAPFPASAVLFPRVRSISRGSTVILAPFPAIWHPASVAWHKASA